MEKWFYKMTKHRDWIIENQNEWFGFEAVHDSYEASFDDGMWQGNYPVFHGNTEQECVEQIDEWYEENE